MIIECSCILDLVQYLIQTGRNQCLGSLKFFVFPFLVLDELEVKNVNVEQLSSNCFHCNPVWFHALPQCLY